MAPKAIKMKEKTRKAVNGAIIPMTTNKYFDGIPLAEIFEAMEAQGVAVIDENWNRWSGFICGEAGQTFFDLAPAEAESVIGFEEIYRDVALCLSWYKMQSGRYEIVTYVM